LKERKGAFTMVSLRRLALAAVLSLPSTNALATATDGIAKLADRLFNGQSSAFEFVLTAEHDNWSRWNPPVNDNYTVASAKGKIRVEGTTLNALARG
jgi:hypothetical protein